MTHTPCPLCTDVGGTLVFQGEKFRVIRADEAGFPAFYRVVWTRHVAEFSDLDDAERSLCMAAVNIVEQALREHLQPSKINLAALGNVVPHLHWHVIARFDWDTHFPAPVWAQASRASDGVCEQLVRDKLERVEQEVVKRLTALGKMAVG
jgi:diadenosine tetraphosphate (Ap4A) HIT family hydrolase